MRSCILRRNSRWPQKWRENDFWGNSQLDSAYILQVKNFIEIAQSLTIIKINAFFTFYAEIQDGRQIW